MHADDANAMINGSEATEKMQCVFNVYDRLHGAMGSYIEEKKTTAIGIETGAKDSAG